MKDSQRNSSSTSYSEKLKDSRWQKQRLRILERDSWTCQKCRSINGSFEVDHLYYDRNLEPWEYPDEDLVALCATCHEAVEGKRRLLKVAVGRAGIDNLDLIHGFALGLRAMRHPAEKFLVAGHKMVIGVAAAWELGAPDVLAVLSTDDTTTGSALAGLFAERP